MLQAPMKHIWVSSNDLSQMVGTTVKTLLVTNKHIIGNPILIKQVDVHSGRLTHNEVLVMRRPVLTATTAGGLSSRTKT